LINLNLFIVESGFSKEEFTSSSYTPLLATETFRLKRMKQDKRTNALVK
jgi:hypothetical protein